MSTFRLTSTVHNPLKTTLVQENGQVLYRFETEGGITTLYRLGQGEASEEKVASLERHIVRKNVIHFADGSSVLQSKFLKPVRFSDKNSTFEAPNGREYRWNRHFRSLELILADKTMSSEIFAKSRKHRRHLFGETEPAYIDISNSLAGILDALVLTWAIEERRRQRAKHGRE